jgi:hypothetical protein
VPPKRSIRDAEVLAERFEERWWCAELCRLRAVFLAATGAERVCEAVRVAKEQKSVSLERRADATYAEYRRQKGSASGARRFRLPLS